METTSSISTFETGSELIGVGIDAELTERFSRFTNSTSAPSPLLYSRKEIDHCRSCSDPATALCAAFCCKEAFFKALRQPYHRPDGELFWVPEKKRYTVSLSDDLRNEFHLSEALAWVEIRQSGVCCVRTYLFRFHS